LRLANGHLQADIRDDPATVAAAYGELEQYLRSWEILTNLHFDSGAMKLHFERMEILDGPPGAQFSEALTDQLRPRGTLHLFVRNAYTLTQYPPQPERFVATSDVVSMWDRYERYKNGRELLTEVAWWCLTTLEWLGGGMPRAAMRYAISDHVLEKLKRLAHVGDERTARKRFNGQILRPHTANEITWMEKAIRRIIHRVGEWESDRNATWPQITMEDFPRL
jgi:HAMP domain-containing protein